MEVDVDEDGSVCLDTLKSQFGPQAATLTYMNELTGRKRLVRVSGNSLLEPKDGWKTNTRVYIVSRGGTTSSHEQPAGAAALLSNPHSRTLISHPMIKREPAAAETVQVASVKPGKAAMTCMYEQLYRSDPWLGEPQHSSYRL